VNPHELTGLIKAFHENAGFEEFPKIPRLSRTCTVTEKLDGTNAQILIEEPLPGVFVTRFGSRSRWLMPGKEHDNYGFCAWGDAHLQQLIAGLGAGRHYGEWWGGGIQRGYGLKEKRFSLFNTGRWAEPDAILGLDDPRTPAPKCCSVVPVIYEGPFDTAAVDAALDGMRRCGSYAAPGFMRPEGIVVYHHAMNGYFKKTLEKDAAPKSNAFDDALFDGILEFGRHAAQGSGRGRVELP